MDGIYSFLDFIMFEAGLNVFLKYNIINSRRTTNVRMNMLL